MKDIIIELIMAFLGSMGFALLYRINRKILLSASMGGALAWMIYLFVFRKTSASFSSTLIASGFAALYAEVLARIKKVPVLIYFIPAVVPMIPGSKLYYTMYFGMQGNVEKSKMFWEDTLKISIAIALGMCIVWSVIMVYKRCSVIWRCDG